MKNDYSNELKRQLIYEFTNKKRGGIYSFIQKLMTYNSNKIEGSTLTEEQTASIFETGTISGDMIYRVKDVEEAQGHFRMFNNVIKALDAPLTVEMIKSMHYDLKVSVFEDYANGYPCGEFKNRRNRVSVIETALPDEVPYKMDSLLAWYLIADKSIESLAVFHAKYEMIHPFQDGNGRTGRMILFKESVKNGMIPIIIRDSEKGVYYAALKSAQVDEDYDKLVQCFTDAQEWFYDKTADMVLSV